MRQIAATTAPERARKTWLALLSAATLAALLLTSSSSLTTGASSTPAAAGTAAAAAPAFQVQRPWTAVGSTGVIDETSLNAFAFSSTELRFRPGSPATDIVARYNVTNTFDNNANPNRPGWTTLEMGSVAPLNTIVEARLFRVSTCTTTPILLCVASNGNNNSNPCARCTFNPAAVDFTNDLFLIEVRLNRANAPAAQPRMFTLRLF